MRPRTSYAPAQRLQVLRAMLASQGLTLGDIMERLEASKSTVRRLLRALEGAGEPLVEETVDGKKVWRLAREAKTSLVRLTTSQLATLVLARKVFGFLDGTGFEEDLDALFTQLAATLKREDAHLAKNLDRKLHDVNEHPHIYDDRGEHIDAILTALLREHRLDVCHDSVDRGAKVFLLDPYSLVIYRKGLYVAGHSHRHAKVITLALDGFRDAGWRRGESFVYPVDYDPRALLKGAFGLFTGPPTRVRVRFDATVERSVRRRRWHETQEIKDLDGGGVEIAMDVAGTTEVSSWVMSFGGYAEVLEPESLRREVAEQLARGAARYAGDAR